MIQDGPLDQLARQLVIPASAGIYLAKSEMIVLAHLSEGSLRVNERRRMLADVLKSPDNLVDLGRLIQRLRDFSQAHIDRYDELTDSFPSLGPILASWRDKASKTIELLAEVQEELEDEPSGG